MPYYRNHRCWYVIFLKGSIDIDYLISACSEQSIRKRLGSIIKFYKILPAKSFHLAKAMSGNPCYLQHPDDTADSQWGMDVDGHYIEVIILN